MKSMVDMSHEFLLPSLHRGAICVDATLGNGKDSMFFIQQNVLKVYAFEIQEDVFQETKNKIESKKFYPYLLGHEKMDEVIQEQVDAIIFNFGYCPGKDESICTHTDTSLCAIEKGLNLLKRKGRMALVIYPHEEGRKEANYIEDYVEKLDSSIFTVVKIKLMNQENSPYLIGIEKK